MNVVHKAALFYAKQGYPVIPIRHDKSPYVKWTEFQKEKPTEEQINEWWTQWPDAYVGIVTGKLSNTLVVDCDTPEAIQTISDMIPDTCEQPIADTPRGGCHLWFQHDDDFTVATSVMPGVDIRGEGGYIIVPPSSNGNGKAYSWRRGCKLRDVAPPTLPENLKKQLKEKIKRSLINNNIYNIYRERGLQSLTDLTSSYIFSVEGRRDEDLFYVANCLIKGGAAPGEAKHVLGILANSCEPPFPQNEIASKISSALQRAEKRERNLSAEIRDWVVLQEGYFSLTKLYSDLQLLQKDERNAAQVAIHRLKADGIIEKWGKKAGDYRRLDKEFEELDFLTADGEEYKVDLPLGLADLGVLYPGNLAVVAGSKEAGKTAFLLNIARMNLGRKKIVYLNSEMGANEMRKRLELFDDTSLGEWAKHMKVFNLKSTQTPADFIDGSDTIWIIDFLEIAEDFSRIALTIGAIHDKLGVGLAFLGLQKADGKEIGRGADFSREKARLYLSLDWEPEHRVNRIKIVDYKAWRHGKNPRGLKLHYKLIGGADIVPMGGWFE